MTLKEEVEKERARTFNKDKDLAIRLISTYGYVDVAREDIAALFEKDPDFIVEKTQSLVYPFCIRIKK